MPLATGTHGQVPAVLLGTLADYTWTKQAEVSQEAARCSPIFWVQPNGLLQLEDPDSWKPSPGVTCLSPGNAVIVHGTIWESG